MNTWKVTWLGEDANAISSNGSLTVGKAMWTVGCSFGATKILSLILSSKTRHLASSILSKFPDAKQSTQPKSNILPGPVFGGQVTMADMFLILNGIDKISNIWYTLTLLSILYYILYRILHRICTIKHLTGLYKGR